MRSGGNIRGHITTLFKCFMSLKIINISLKKNEITPSFLFYNSYFLFVKLFFNNCEI